MKAFNADLHIHTVLSPCGDLEMSPGNIVKEASSKGLDIIGITDHNTTRHANLVSRLAEKKGIFVMTGAEITTREEVHCLVFFENIDTLTLLQEFLDKNLPDISNVPEIFGYQLEVDENEKILYEEPKLLISAISVSISDLEHFVHQNNGIFIPAHIDRMKNSIYSQLGFIPDSMKADALEVSKAVPIEKFRREHPETGKFPIIRSSDSHFIDDIGTVFTVFHTAERSFDEIRMALKGIEGRGISIS